MKTATIALIISLALVSQAEAQTKCYKNYFGDQICRNDSGDSSTGRQNFFGDTDWKNSDGDTQSCHENYFGETVCN